MRKPSTKRRRLLEKAVTGYQTHLTIAAPYLAARGLTKEVCEAARLGVVISPEAGHEHVYGRLAIPYMDMQGVYSLRFRCLEQHDCKDVSCPKYLGVQGDETGIYAVEDTDLPAETAHITEGELDRLILKIVFPTIAWLLYLAPSPGSHITSITFKALSPCLFGVTGTKPVGKWQRRSSVRYVWRNQSLCPPAMMSTRYTWKRALTQSESSQEKPTTRRLIFNSARCNKCNTQIVSAGRYDFQSCYCGDVSVDGGLAYRRMLWASDADWTDLCVYEGDE
jgi:hypothetical protein